MLNKVKGSVNIDCDVGGRKGQNKSAKLNGKIIKDRKYYNNYFTRGRIMLQSVRYACQTISLHRYPESENCGVQQK